MDLDTVADELYSASPDEFVERRKQRADEARAAKDRPLVKAIGQLRRPTRSAWMVNLLSRELPDEVQSLLELGAALGEASRRASGPDLRRLSKERQSTLDALTKRSAQLANDHGHSPTEATRQEVSQTLQAALADASVAELVRTGRVVQAATYGGFGPMDLFGSALVTSDEPAGDQAAAEPAAAESEPEEDAAVTSARQAAAAADDALDVATAEVADGETAADEATARADELADRVETLRARLSEAESEERAARESARAARKRLQQLHQAATDAEAVRARAHQTLADLTP